MFDPTHRTTTIMIVEDQRVAAGAMRRRLQGLGYQIAATVTDGESAIHKAVELRPDLILMDIRLGAGIDGIDAARRIREQADIPVVFITAFADEALLARAKRAHPAGFINKPFTTKDLLSAIGLAIGDKTTEAPESAPLPEPGEGVITTDADARITYVNRAAERLTGWTRKDLMGEPLTEVIATLYSMSAGASAELVRAVLDRRDTIRPYELALDKDESTKDDVLAPLTDAYGGCFGVALNFRRTPPDLKDAPEKSALSALEAACDRLPLGVVVITRSLAIRFANTAARRILSHADGLREEAGHLTVTDRQDYMTLVGMVEDASAQRAPTDVQAFGMSNPGNRERFEIAVASLSLGPTAAEPLVAVYLFAPQPQIEVDVRILSMLYNFTASEASLVMGLARGETLEEAAERMEIRLTTVRTHLKHVFQKTGVTGKAELMHRIQTGPAALIAEPRLRLH